MDESTQPEIPVQSHAPLSSKRTLRVDQVYSKKDRRLHYVKSLKSNKRDERKFTLVVRRIIALDGSLSSTKVDIKAPRLAALLSGILKNSKSPGLNNDPPWFSPMTLYHAVPILQKQRVEELSRETVDRRLIDDIDEVIIFVTEHFSSKLSDIESLHRNGRITYDLLWTLFPPECQIIQRSNTTNELQAFKFVQGSYTEDQHTKKYEIEVSSIRHDGEDFGWGEETLDIPEFPGTKAITSLEIYPLHHHHDEPSWQKDLLLGGKDFPNLVHPTLKDYDGMAIEAVYEFAKWVEKRFYVTGKVMIDPAAFKLHNPDSSLLRPWVYTGFDPTDMKDEDSIFCTRRALGFSFETKKWGSFAISGLRQVVWDDGAMTKVIIPDKQRQLITSLVKNHKADDSGFDDVIRGKGKGLVGLLSGGPGVGKTLTAEVVAEISKRALYVVTAGELGINAVELDKKLNAIWSVVHRWGCLLLIDEADIFLRKRTDGQIEQNALVSIFLRRLEYFQGIIILTTNRRQDIDEAFKSRIHFKFHYPPLDEQGRLAIWKNFLSGKLYNDDPDRQQQGYKELSQIPLNGREIKNAVSCTLSVIRSSHDPLTVAIIKDVIDNLTGSWD